LFVVFLLFGGGVGGQGAVQSLADLPSRVQKGERVKVTLRDGTIVGARFDSVSGSSLRVMSSGKTIREIPGSSVTQITKRREDSVMNGLLIGLAVGAGAGLVATTSTCEN